MVRRISGKYKANSVSHIKYNYNDITDVKEICNTLAKQSRSTIMFRSFLHITSTEFICGSE